MFRNEKYKVSLVYGAKVILVPKLLYKYIKLFIQHKTPIELLGVDIYFLKNTGSKDVIEQMTQSTITWCLTRSFEKVDPSMIRLKHARESLAVVYASA